MADYNTFSHKLNLMNINKFQELHYFTTIENGGDCVYYYLEYNKILMNELKNIDFFSKTAYHDNSFYDINNSYLIPTNKINLPYINIIYIRWPQNERRCDFNPSAIQPGRFISLLIDYLALNYKLINISPPILIDGSKTINFIKNNQEYFKLQSFNNNFQNKINKLEEELNKKDMLNKRLIDTLMLYRYKEFNDTTTYDYNEIKQKNKALNNEFKRVAKLMKLT